MHDDNSATLPQPLTRARSSRLSNVTSCPNQMRFRVVNKGREWRQGCAATHLQHAAVSLRWAEEGADELLVLKEGKEGRELKGEAGG